MQNFYAGIVTGGFISACFLCLILFVISHNPGILVAGCLAGFWATHFFKKFSKLISMFDISKITRFELIDHREDIANHGRIYAERNVIVDLSLQDNGRTLKVFVKDKE